MSLLLTLLKNYWHYAAIAVAFSGGWLYYTHTEDLIIELQADKVKLQLNYETSLSTITVMEEAYNTTVIELNKLNNKLQQSDSENNKLRDLLVEHDLKYLALKKPRLIENRINDGIKNVFKEINAITSD